MKLNPCTRLIIVLCFSTLSVLAMDIVYLALLFLVALLLDIVLGVDLLLVLKKFRFILTVIVFIVVVQSLTIKGGHILLHIGRIRLITTTGAIKGGEFALRMLVIILASAVVLQVPHKEMIDGLILLKLPYELAFMSVVALQFLPKFSKEFAHRLTAIKMRGININELGLKKKIKVYSHIIFPTVSGSILKSKQLAIAMEIRAFGAYDKRTMLGEYSLKICDYCVIISVIGLSIAFLILMYLKGSVI